MKKKLGLLVLALLACIALPLCAAQAITANEIPAYLGEWNANDANYERISIGPQSSLGEVLGWLDSFLDKRAGYTVQAATDLAELVEVIEQDGNALRNAGDKAEVLQLLQRSSDLNAHTQYYFDKLHTCYIQCSGDLNEIRSGRLNAERQRAYADNILSLLDEADVLRREAIEFINSNGPDGWTVNADSLAAALDINGGNGALIQSLREAGFDILHRQAEKLAAQDANGMNGQDGEPPRVVVISDKEIAFSVRLEGGESPAGIPIWLRRYDPAQPGANAWFKREVGSSGVAWFPVADFMPDRNGDVFVEVIFNAAESGITLDGNGNVVGSQSFRAGYQRREYGAVSMKGGESINVVLPKTNGEPYLIRATFNGIDMCNTGNGMWLTEKNDAEHAIALKLYTGDAPHSVGVGNITGTGGSIDHFAARATFPARADTAQVIKGKYCRLGESNAFLPDQTIYIQIDPPGTQHNSGQKAGNGSPIPAAFKMQKAHHDYNVMYNQPGSNVGQGLSMFIPDEVPIYGGMQMGYPFFGIATYYFEPGKVLKVGTNYPVVPAELRWQVEDMRAQEKRIGEEKERAAADTQLSREGIAILSAQTFELPFIGTFSTTMTTYSYILMEYDSKSDLYEGGVSFGTVMAIKFGIVEWFMAGPVPIFVTASIDYKLNLGKALRARANVDNIQGTIYDWEYPGEYSFLFKEHIGVALGGGTGIPYVAKVALQGGGWMDMTKVFGSGQYAKSEVGMKAEVALEIAWWKWSWVFWNYVRPGDSTVQQYMVVNAAKHSEPIVTALDQANALPGNYTHTASGALKGEAVTEIAIVSDLPANGADIKYLDLYYEEGDVWQNFAFWIGNVKIDGVDTARILYKNLDTDSEVMALDNQCSTDGIGDHSRDHVIDFDIDSTKGYIAVCYTSRPEPVKPHQGDVPPADLCEIMLKEQESTSLFLTEYWLFRDGLLHRNNYLFGPSENYRPGKKNVPAFVPRVRYTRDPATQAEWHMAEDISFGGVQLEKKEDGTICYTVSSRAYWTEHLDSKNEMHGGDFFTMTGLDASVYYLPDFHILDFQSFSSWWDKMVPVVIVLAQRLDDPCRSRLAIGISALEGEVSDEIDCNVMVPMREYYKDGRYQMGAMTFLRALKTGDEGALSNNVSICYFDSGRSNGLWARDVSAWSRKNVIRDMGVQIDADALNVVNVNVMGSNQMYAYWLRTTMGENQGDAEQHQIMATLIDTRKKACTPAFVLATLQKNAVNLKLLNLSDLSKPMTGYYLHTDTESLADGGGKSISGIRKIEFPLTATSNILSFSSEFPVISQGKPFGMYFRFENAGSLVLRGVTVNIKAVNVNGKEEPVLIKGVKIDLENPRENAVTQYDFTDASGRPTVLTGDHAIYRVPDVMDTQAGNTVVCTNIKLFQGGSHETELVTMLGLLPGGIATYKTNVVNSPTAWHGEYDLYAEVDTVNFTLGMSENNTVYTAKRGKDNRFTVTYTDEQGNSHAVSADGLFACIAKPASTADAGGGSRYLTSNGAQTKDRIYANINHNNLKLTANTVRLDGEEYASVTLSNDAFRDGRGINDPRGVGVIPMISVLLDGKVVKQIRLSTELEGGFARNLMLPLSELTGGRPYDEIKLVATSGAASKAMVEAGNEAQFEELYKEINLYGGTATITPVHSFTVSDPADVTVFEGDTAAFTVAAQGGSGSFTYQWYVVLPDGTSQIVGGAIRNSLTLEKVTLAKSGLRYRCEVSDGRTVLRTAAALLTVTKKPPRTGDAFPSAPLIALLCVSGCIILMLARRRRA